MHDDALKFEPLMVFDDVEAVIQRDAGRGIAPLAEAARGGLTRAVNMIQRSQSPVVCILTGFFIPDADPPAPETDGPPGAVALAQLLGEAGIRTHLLTDARCAGVLKLTAGSIAPVHVVDDETTAESMRAILIDEGVTHLVLVERPGPAADGETYNMRGEVISPFVTPMRRLLEAPPWETIAIGDGGNELGMGSLATDLVGQTIKHGARIHCVVPCDALIVAGVSNWGAIALGAAIASRSRDVELRLVARHAELLGAAIAGGAVDGATRRREFSVDGLPEEAHAAVLAQIEAALVTPRAIAAGAAARDS